MSDNSADFGIGVIVTLLALTVVACVFSLGYTFGYNDRIYTEKRAARLAGAK